MPSYLEKQQAAFNAEMKSVAPKLVNNRTTLAAPPVSAPSPAPSNSSATSRSEVKDGKRKRESTNEVYSQPSITGLGAEAGTQVLYAIEFMKKKDKPKTLEELLRYLSMTNADIGTKKTILRILKKHPKVRWTEDPQSKAWDSGTFTYLPILNVRNDNDLLTFLQNKPDVQGVKVSDLKDGWPNCARTIDVLDANNQILVTRTKKDDAAKCVWPNDPSLVHNVDDEFKLMWQKIELPGVDDLIKKLLDAGQKPASDDPSKRIKVAPLAKQKKKRAPRKGMKTTNSHMQHLLKDFSHLRK